MALSRYHSTKDLSKFHMLFIAITNWLIEKQQLGVLEQQRAYVCVFQPQLLATIMNHLQLKHPDHHLTTLYKMEDVYNATCFVLQSSAAIGYQMVEPFKDKHMETQNSRIKKEELSAMFAKFGKVIVEVLNLNNQPRNRQNSGNRMMECSMCGGPHWIRDCTIVDDYTKAGKSKKNHEGKIVLLSGAFVPRDVPGQWLMNRINKWHRQNLNQLAVALMVNTINKRIVYPKAKLEPIYQLLTADWIVTLEAELFNLYTRKPPAKYRPWTWLQKDRAPTVETEDEEEVQGSRVEEVKEEPIPKTPEHPFRNAKDVVYISPTLKNVVEPKKDRRLQKLSRSWNQHINLDLWYTILQLQVAFTNNWWTHQLLFPSKNYSHFLWRSAHKSKNVSHSPLSS